MLMLDDSHIAVGNITELKVKFFCGIYLFLYVLYMQSEVAKVVETQTSLERQLELIETHQGEVCLLPFKLLLVTHFWGSLLLLLCSSLCV